MHQLKTDMKPKFPQIFVVLTLSLLVSLFPAYLRFADLSDDHLPFSDLGFENPDDDVSLIGEHKQTKLLAVVTFSHVFSPKIHIILGHVSCFFSLINPLSPKPSTLRC